MSERLRLMESVSGDLVSFEEAPIGAGLGGQADACYRMVHELHWTCDSALGALFRAHNSIKPL